MEMQPLIRSGVLAMVALVGLGGSPAAGAVYVKDIVVKDGASLRIGNCNEILLLVERSGTEATGAGLSLALTFNVQLRVMNPSGGSTQSSLTGIIDPYVPLKIVTFRDVDTSQPGSYQLQGLLVNQVSRQESFVLSGWCTPPPAPVLRLPLWSSADGSHVAVGSGVVRLRSVAGADRYQLCLRNSGQTTCYVNQTPSGSSASVLSNGDLQFAVSVPADRQSTIGEWTARGCNGNANAPNCGPWATAERFTVVPDPPTVTAPTNGYAWGNRRVAFVWQNSSYANAGYQLVLWRANSSSGYNVYQPTAPLTVPATSISIPAGTTSTTLDLVPGLTSVRWMIVSCANFTGKGRRCSLGYATRSFAAPPYFASVLVPTFEHERCINCHAVAADQFQKDTASDSSKGLPQDHSTVSAVTTCSSSTCHVSTLLPAGSVDPGWHAAPSALDFRNRSVQELCARARDRGTKATSVFNHLTQDRLVLWAVGSGAVPGGKTLAKAPPESISKWTEQIKAWTDAGMPCD